MIVTVRSAVVLGAIALNALTVASPTSTNYAGFSSGTLVLFRLTHDALIVGADSRAITRTANGTEAPDDTTCKIIPLSNYSLVAIFGLAGTTEAENYSTSTATESFAQLGKAREVGAIGRIASDWSRKLLPLYLENQRHFPQQRDISGGAVFAGINVLGRIETEVVIFKLDSGGALKPDLSVEDVPTGRELWEAHGRANFAVKVRNTTPSLREFYSRPSEAGIPDFMRRWINATAKRDPEKTIGGPVDIVKLTTHGISVISLKPSCRGGLVMSQGKH